MLLLWSEWTPSKTKKNFFDSAWQDLKNKKKLFDTATLPGHKSELKLLDDNSELFAYPGVI